MILRFCFLLFVILVGMVQLSFAKLHYGRIVGASEKDHVFYEWDGQDYVMDGDILVTPFDHHKSVHRKNKKWPGGVVPYVIDEEIPDSNRIVEAINYFSIYTSIRLVPRVDEEDYIYFQDNGAGGGCSSYVGRNGGRQKIKIPDWCKKGSIIHEIMHALGFYHEQSRPDRNKWIKIKWTNIKLSKFQNFFAHFFAKKYGDFDFDSIMLYPSYNSFARNIKKPVLTTREGDTWSVQRNGLSIGDLDGLANLYEK